ncbi:MAG: transglycosylase SLT domain-containing protein, partial [bacterium]
MSTKPSSQSGNNYSILRRVVTQEMGTGAAADAMYDYLCAIKSHESNGNRFAVNPDSKAKGLFQFVGTTAR